MLEQLVETFPNDVRLIYRHFPLNIHENAALAVQASEAAGLQGKFWEMHDLLFEKQGEWANFSEEEFQTWLIDNAGEIGINAREFSEELNSPELESIAENAWVENSAIGMPGTPFILVNGRYYNGRLDFANLQALVKVTLMEKIQFSECPPMSIDPSKTHIAVIHTEKGDIKIELFADKAPLAVNSFIFLAKQGWFDGVTFHRVLTGYIAQTGDPSGTGFGGPGYAFDNEISPSLTFDGAGVVAMANAGPGSNGSQFFITYRSTPDLNGGYTIFGRVIAGMEVVQSLTPRDPAQALDLPPGDKILSVTIEER